MGEASSPGDRSPQVSVEFFEGGTRHAVGEAAEIEDRPRKDMDFGYIQGEMERKVGVEDGANDGFLFGQLFAYKILALRVVDADVSADVVMVAN